MRTNPLMLRRYCWTIFHLVRVKNQQLLFCLFGTAKILLHVLLLLRSFYFQRKFDSNISFFFCTNILPLIPFVTYIKKTGTKSQKTSIAQFAYFCVAI